MLVDVIMPQAGQDLEVGVVRQWLKREGDPVQRGESIVQIETEKMRTNVTWKSSVAADTAKMPA